MSHDRDSQTYRATEKQALRQISAMADTYPGAHLCAHRLAMAKAVQGDLRGAQEVLDSQFEAMQQILADCDRLAQFVLASYPEDDDD